MEKIPVKCCECDELLAYCKYNPDPIIRSKDFEQIRDDWRVENGRKMDNCPKCNTITIGLVRGDDVVKTKRIVLQPIELPSGFFSKIKEIFGC